MPTQGKTSYTYRICISMILKSSTWWRELVLFPMFSIVRQFDEYIFGNQSLSLFLTLFVSPSVCSECFTDSLHHIVSTCKWTKPIIIEQMETAAAQDHTGRWPLKPSVSEAEAWHEAEVSLMWCIVGNNQGVDMMQGLIAVPSALAARNLRTCVVINSPSPPLRGCFLARCVTLLISFWSFSPWGLWAELIRIPSTLLLNVSMTQEYLFLAAARV